MKGKYKQAGSSLVIHYNSSPALFQDATQSSQNCTLPWQTAVTEISSKTFTSRNIVQGDFCPLNKSQSLKKNPARIEVIFARYLIHE